jgi:hypothetical protein
VGVAVKAIKIAAERNKKGFNMAASSFAGVENRHHAVSKISATNYRPYLCHGPSAKH